MVYSDFVQSLGTKTNRILNICTNGELFQRQKADLLHRALESVNCSHLATKYVCVGSVKVDSTELNTDLNDSIYNYDLREKYFRHSAEQRQVISDDLSSQNVKMFTLFSIIFDLLASHLHVDVRKFPIIELLDLDESNVKFCEQSSFILYNCARLSAILEKFKSLTKQGNHFVIYEKCNSKHLMTHLK